MSDNQSPHETSNKATTGISSTAASTVAQHDEEQPNASHHHHHTDDEAPKSNEPVRREETPFSLKHFLKRNSTSNHSSAAPTTTSTDGAAHPATTTSTGARPKVPLNANVLPYETAKMKRSPKFSSFDSQASLAEFSASSSSTSLPTTTSNASPHNIRPVENLSSHPEHYSCDAASDKASFQRSVSTFDIGAGGRRYNTNHRLDGFLRASSIPIADDDDDDDLLESPTHHVAYDQPQRRPLMGNLSQDISSALPDFVQDHLLVEHLYNNYNSSGSQMAQCDRLPDFTLNDLASADVVRTRDDRLFNDSDAGGPTNNMPFDLMCNNNNSSSTPGGSHDQSSQGSLPFDLPRRVDDRPATRPRSAARQPQSNGTGQINDIPLDLTARNELPFADAQSRRSNNPVESYVSDFGPGAVLADTFQRLPDFLSDGHVHSSSALAGRQPNSHNSNNANIARAAEPLVEHPADAELVPGLDVTAAGNNTSAAVTRSLVNNLQLENLRLRQQLEQCNTTMSDQALIITGLQATVDQVDRVQSEQRTQSAAQSHVVSALQRQIQELNVQVELLRKENSILKEEGAVGGAASATPPCLPGGVIEQTQQLARDMRLAATSAESHLRQLLSGVDNLRILAQRVDHLGELDLRSPSSVESNRHIGTEEGEDDDAAEALDHHWDKDD